MKKLSVLMILSVAVSAFGQYSTSFEGVDPLAGWTVGAYQTAAMTVETGIVHSGTQAIRLEATGARDYISYPIADYGTLEVMVYDLGEELDAGSNLNGGYWGIVNAGQIVGGSIWNRSYLRSSNGYAMSAGNNTGSSHSWYSGTYFGPVIGIRDSPTHDPLDPTYVAPRAGWVKWTITVGETVFSMSAENAAGDVREHVDIAYTGTWVDGTPPDSIMLFGGKNTAMGIIVDDVSWTPGTGSPTCNPGDADGDGDVDLDDFVLLKNNFGATTGATCAEGDFDGDGDVDLDDFVLLKNNFGMTY